MRRLRSGGSGRWLCWLTSAVRVYQMAAVVAAHACWLVVGPGLCPARQMSRQPRLGLWSLRQGVLQLLAVALWQAAAFSG
jgi:hypothetical protein